jgi:DNA primase
MSIPELKSKLSILTVLNHYNIKPDKNNRVACPFHDDKTPSMQIYPKTNTYCCFSSNCSAGTGDQIEFIQKMEKCNKHQALKKAAEFINVPMNQYTNVPMKGKLTDEKQNEKSMEEIFIELQEQLKQSPEAKNYLQSRNLTAEKLEIGYNPTVKPVIKDLKNCIIFPLRDKENAIVSFYGRSISNNTDQRHFYLKDRAGIYPNYPKQATEKLIITEAVIDAATLIMNDELLIMNETKPAIIACFGTNGLNEEILSSIKELPNLNEIIFAFDNDEAGKAATEKHCKTLSELLTNVTISNVELPMKDVNETLQAHDENIFTHLLNERKTLYSQEIQVENEPYNLSTLQLSNPSATTLNLKPETLNCQNPDQLQYNTDELLITLLGGISMNNLDRMRITIYMRRNPHINAAYSIRQNIDLYQDDLVEKFIRRSAEKLEISTSLISKAIAELTEELENYRLQQVENKKKTTVQKKELTQIEKQEAMENLKRKDLMEWTMKAYEKTGIIGELTNAMILHFAMVSRKSEDPVSVICLSASGTGKSYLLEKVAQCFPTEDIIENTQMTENSFYYYKRDEIKHKIVLIEDMDGASAVEYPIRELISKKRISKTVTLKDNKGNLRTITLTVEGPVTFCGCTTKEKLYEDNANRCILIYLDNTKEQDEKVMHYHKELRAGLIDKSEEQQIREQLQNMQRLIKSMRVINPYAPLIHLPQEVFKPRRTLSLLLSFIEAITLYHQYQSPKEQDAIITHPSHIEWGFKLLKESLFRKSDELNATLRNFLEELKALMKKENKKSFYANDMRTQLRIPPRTLARYLYELTQYGYLRIAGGNKYRKGYEYEIIQMKNNLQSNIEKHIERVMQRIWQAYYAEKQKISEPVSQS